MFDFIQHSWLALFSSLLTGILVGWAMIISHWGANEKILKITLIVALPLVVLLWVCNAYSSFNNYFQNKTQEVQIEHEQSEIAYLSKQSQDIKNSLASDEISLSNNENKIQQIKVSLNNVDGDIENYATKTDSIINKSSDQLNKDITEELAIENKNSSSTKKILWDTKVALNEIEKENQQSATKLHAQIDDLKSKIVANKSVVVDQVNGFTQSTNNTDQISSQEFMIGNGMPNLSYNYQKTNITPNVNEYQLNASERAALTAGEQTLRNSLLNSDDQVSSQIHTITLPRIPATTLPTMTLPATKLPAIPPTTISAYNFGPTN